MAATKLTLDFTLTVGRAFELPFTWGTRATPTSATVPSDPTGYILRIQIRKNAASDVVVASFSSEPSDSLGGAEGTVTLLGAVENNVTLALTAAQADLLEGHVGSYVYDCKWGPAADRKFVKGTVTIEDEITR